MPVKPSDFKAVIVLPTDSLARGFAKVIYSWILWYRLYRWMFDSGGAISYEFAQFLCSQPCPQVNPTA